MELISPVQVAAIILFEGESVLLVRHTNSKHIEGIYGLPGGRLEKGETEIQAAARELEEETGLTATEENLIRLPTLWKADVTFKDGSVRACAMSVFLCKHYKGELRGTDTEAPEWFPLSEVARLHLLPNVENAIREAKEISQNKSY